MKECRTCKKEKEESEFSVNRYKSDGTPIYKPDCKACKRKTDKAKPNIKKETVITKSIEPIIVKPVKSDIFTNEEIKILKLIVSQFKILPLEDKSNRKPRSINLDNSLFKKVQEFSEKNKLTISDSINLLIAKSLQLITN